MVSKEAIRLTYAAKQITSGDDSLTLMVGADTQVFYGFVNCGGTGAITGPVFQKANGVELMFRNRLDGSGK